MKKLIAVILVCLVCLTTALAAEWPEGTSPAKPTKLKPEVDLNKTVGYWLEFPRKGLPAEIFCDVLELYMPNPDIKLGEGTATLWDANGEVCVIDFTNPAQVELRDLEESELEAMHWGCGVCVEMHLPISLKFDENYYVTMDEGTLVTHEGAVKSMPIPYSDKVDITEQYWTPSVTSDYGISGLYYSAPEAEAAETGEGEAEEAGEGAVQPKYNPVKGDIVNFDVVLGGDAKIAVMVSEDNSVYFDTMEFHENGHVTGTVVGDVPNWGVVFADEDGTPVDYIQMTQFEEEAEEAAAE